jgi:regulator of PEP synthase PpsR (kinase-PPPase family)
MSAHSFRATSNLYVLVQKRNPLAPSQLDTLSQLEKVCFLLVIMIAKLIREQIQQFIIDLQDVTSEYEKNLEKELEEKARLAQQTA